MIVGILRFSRYLLKVRVTKLRATFGWRGVSRRRCRRRRRVIAAADMVS